MGMRKVRTIGAGQSTSKVQLFFSAFSFFFLFTSSNLFTITRDSIAIGVKWVTEYNTGTGMDSDLETREPRLRWVRTGIDDGGSSVVLPNSMQPREDCTPLFIFFFTFLSSSAKGLSI
jgi:hypothetical protein